MKANDYVWFNNEGWIYLGMDEDGCTHLYRPIKAHPFRLIEFNTVWADELEQFMKDNGE
jgi:hypothetical protein